MADPQDVRILGADGKTWYSLKGPKGDDGKAGPPGPPLNVKDSVADEAALKALPKAGNQKGDARVVDKTGDMYVWDGNDWHKTSHLKGDQGVPGRGIHVFPNKETDEPKQGTDPVKEPDKAYAGDIWIIPAP